MLGPISALSLCSRLSRDVAYCWPVRLNPSVDKEYAIEGKPGPSPGLVGNECQELWGVSSSGLKVKRRPGPGGSWDSVKVLTAAP